MIFVSVLKLKIDVSGTVGDEAWRQIVARAPSFGGYPGKTDRQIPVVRLTAVD